MKKGRNRVLRVILAFLLVFTSFAPSLAFALEEPLSWDIETPAGYDFVNGGTVRLYNLSTSQTYYSSISNSKVTFNNQFTIEDSATYAIESSLNFRNADWSDEITYYDYQTISGTNLKQLTTLALPENAKVINLKLDTIPLAQKNVTIVSNFKYANGFASSIHTIASKVATSLETITLTVTGQNEQKHGYFANTTIQTASTEEVDFAEVFTQLVPFELQGDATVNYLELGSKAFTSRWGGSQITKWFVTPGSYELNVETSLAVPGGDFSASWKLENINITKETTLVKPSLPDNVSVKSLNWYNRNRADLQLEYSSEGYVLNWQNSNTLMTNLEVKGHDGTTLVNESATLNNYMDITLPERYSGTGEFVVTVLNGEEELARTSVPFELQDQDDTSIHGLVVTAEDEKGIPLQSGRVAVSERLNPNYSYYNNENGYQITQIYGTSFKEHEGNYEAFIPNAYLLAGREYEIVVEGVTAQNEKIIYHKSITANDLSTIHFEGNQLTELEIQTDKQFEEGYFGLTAVDMTIKRIVSWPYMVHPNQKIYVQSDYGMLVNAQLVNTTEDVGYYYSKVIETGDNLKQTIDLDALDANMTKLEAPAGYEQAKIGVHNIWYSNSRASTFYISNPLDDFQFGNSLALTLDVMENGYFYEFYKYHYDANTPINLEIAGDYDGWISQGPTNEETKETTYYTYYANQNDMRIEYVGPENPVVTDQNVYFNVINQNGQKQRMVTNTNGGFAEATDATVQNASTNLVSYQIYKEEVPVGEPLSTNTIGSVKFTLPEEPGAYQLKLEAQSFPTDVTALSLNSGFNVNDNDQDMKRISFSYSDPEYVLSDWADVRMIEIGKHPDNTSFAMNNIYFNRNDDTKQYETNFRINPEAEYFLIYQGQLRKSGNYQSILSYKKLTGAEFIALSEVVIDHGQMMPISMTNETAIKQNLNFRMIATLEDEIKFSSHLSGGYTNKVDALVSPGLYEPVLEGINGTDGYSVIYPKREIKTAENIRLTTLPTIAVNIVKNNQEVPFKRFGVLYGNSLSTTGFDYSYSKNIMRKLHITPGQTMLSFNMIQIEENETPWRYELMTDMKEFNANTSLNLTDEFVPVQRYFYMDNYDGRTYIDTRYSFYTGDLYLQHVSVGKPLQQWRPAEAEADAEQPIRDYDGKFEYFENPRATFKIVNDQGKIVHKADYQWSYGYAQVQKELAPGKYTLHYQLPVGPNKLASYSRMFDVVNANTPFVTLHSPDHNSVTNNRNVTIAGMSIPNASVKVKIYNTGTTTLVSERTVTADANGNFSTSVTIQTDGRYDVYGYRENAESNKLTFTVDTTPPAKPENVQVEQVSNTLKVTWNAVSDAKNYKVEMATGNGAFQVMNDNLTANQYVLTTIQPATTYTFRISARDEAGNVSAASNVASFETSSFVATKLEVLGQTSSFRLYKIDQELVLKLEGSYKAGYHAKATVTYETGIIAESSQVDLTYNEETKYYEGKFVITEGMKRILNAEAWIINDLAEETDKLNQAINTTVGATFTGQVTEAGADLTSKAKVRLVGKSTVTIDTDETGHFRGEGIPAGDYSVNVVYPSVGGKTYYNVTNGKMTLAHGQKTELQTNISLPAYRDITVKFVEAGTTTAPTQNLSVQISNQLGYVQYGYINVDGQFSTWGNVTTLKGLQTGDYQVRVYKQGLYRDTTATITIAGDQDYINNPFVIEVDKLTADTKAVTLQFTNEELTSIDSISLISWTAYEAYGYSGIGSYYVSYKDVTDGKIVLPDVVYADDYQLFINKQGYRQFTQSPITIDENSEVIEVTLDQGLTLTGNINNADGEAIPGALVNAYSNNSYAGITAGQDGSFELQGLSRNEKITVEVSAPNYVPYRHTYEASEVGTELNIVMKKAAFVHGKVVDKNNKPLKYVYVTAYKAMDNPAEGSKELADYKGWARTGTDGYFIINGLESGEYDLHITNYQLPDLVERKVQTATDGFVFMLQEKGEGSFVGAGNGLTASKQTVVPGKSIQYRLSYQNNGSADVENIPLKVTLPANVDIIEQSVQLNGKPVAWNNGAVNVEKVAKGETGSLTFEVKVKAGSESIVQTTAMINDSVVQPAEVLSAVTNVLFVTINAPATTAQQKIKVYGHAQTGSAVEVYANGALLTKVNVDGRWWFADVTLPVKVATEEESFTLVAKVLDGTESVTSEQVVVNYSPSIAQIQDLTVYAGWNGNVKLNPYTGVATFAIVEKTPLDTTVVFDEEIDSASITFLGETYDMKTQNKKTFTFDGRRLGDWSSYGEQLLELTYTKGDVTITLPIMEIIVLIDPSGYVFEGSMDAPLAGVTAVVEQLVNGEWVRWNADFFGQINPQMTDENGRYGWDVIQGDWRVIFTKEGYEPYISRIVSVPPPETQLNVPLVRKADPIVESISPNGQNGIDVSTNLTVAFDRLMSTVDKENLVKLYKINGQERTEVQGAVIVNEVNGYKETAGAAGFFEEDATTKLAKTFTFDPAATLEAGTTYELEVSASFEDYSGKLLGEKVTQRFTTKQAPTPPIPPVDNGGGIYIPIPSTDLEVVNGVLVVDEKWFTMSGTKGTVKEEAVLVAISRSASFEKLVLKGALVTDFAFSSTLLKAIKDKNSKATVVVENELGSFTLPVAALNITELAGKFGSDDLAIVVSVAKSERSFLEKGVTVMSAPVQFTLSVSGNGKTETVNRFGMFVERKINVTSNIDAAKATAVKLMENGFVAAPTLFKGQVATIKSNTLGTFVIVQANRSFDDVDNGKNWAESYIETLASKFIIKGKTETSYGPTDQMTRAQFAILIARSLGLTASEEYKGHFKDITTEQGANEYAEVIAAYEAGIIQGRPDGTFAPNATITRTQAAAMLARAMKYVGYDASKLDKTKKVSSFKDAKLVQEWAIADIELIVQAGIMNGSPDGSFNPNAATKRDQMAKMLGEFLVFVGLMGK
jgi:uncharacterized repeat protein (TIGR01451 family)